MAKMFTKGFKPKSTTKKSKELIRKEMLSYFPARGYGVRSNLYAMKIDAEGGANPREHLTDYAKGSNLVQNGCLRIYYDDQAEFLSKIYGKDKIKKWDNQKIHDTYKHLVGREYSSMLREKGRK